MCKIITLLVICTIAHVHSWMKLSMLSPRTRLIIGESTTIEKFPHQISLQYFNQHICGGSIIGSTWIITSRRCVFGDIKEFSVRTGSTFHNEGGTTYDVAEIIPYESAYEPPHDDIALIRLAKSMFFDDKCQPVPLFKTGEVAIPGTMANISGWTNQTNNIDVVLQMTTAPIISKAQCNDSYASCGGIPEKQICTGWPEIVRDVCNENSGNPLIIDKRLAGIVSWRGPGCKTIRYPSVYTEISEYRQWIKGKTEI